jgi:tetratricopeptide (TPR) repeat protein
MIVSNLLKQGLKKSRLGIVCLIIALSVFRLMPAMTIFEWNLASIQLTRMLSLESGSSVPPFGVVSIRSMVAQNLKSSPLLGKIGTFSSCPQTTCQRRKAEILWLSGNTDDSVKKMADLRMNDQLAAVELGSMLFQMERDAAAADVWKQFQDMTKVTLVHAYFLQEGDIAFKTHQLSDSVRFFRMATMLAPVDFFAWRGLGNALLQQHDWEAAKLAYVRATSLAKDGQSAIEEAWKYGDLLVRSNSLPDGLAALRLVLDVDPHWEPAWVSYGNALLTQGQSRAAGEAYVTAVQLNPNSPSASVAYGAWLLTQDPDLSGAVRYFEQGISLDSAGYNIYALDPGPWQYQKVIVAYWSVQKFDEAAAWAQRAITAFPNHPVPYYMAGQTAMKVRSLSDAIDWFEKALAHDSKFSEAYDGLAQAYDELGRKDLSQEYREKAQQVRTTQ